MTQFRPTLGKSERIYHRKAIDALFKEGNSHSMSAFPLRAVYMLVPTTDSDEKQDKKTECPQAKFLISVPKHCFRRAVKRNRIKRLVREAYRHNKGLHLDGPADAYRRNGQQKRRQSAFPHPREDGRN